MKKFISLLSVLFLLLSLIACKKSIENFSSDKIIMSSTIAESSNTVTNNEDTTISEIQSQDNNENANSVTITTNTNESTVTASEISHAHSYSNATCTEPAKCVCGTTQGSALGHDWQSATCQSPKLCKVCGATEGSTGTHKYVDGRCKICAKVDGDKARDILYNWFSQNCVDANYGKYYFLPSDNNYYLSAMKTGDIFFYYHNANNNENIVLSVYGFEKNKCYLTYICDNMTVEGEFPLDSLHSTDRNFFNIMNSTEDGAVKTQLIENARNKIDAFLLKLENEVLKPQINITLNDLGFLCY